MKQGITPKEEDLLPLVDPESSKTKKKFCRIVVRKKRVGIRAKNLQHILCECSIPDMLLYTCPFLAQAAKRGGIFFLWEERRRGEFFYSIFSSFFWEDDRCARVKPTGAWIFCCSVRSNMSDSNNTQRWRPGSNKFHSIYSTCFPVFFLSDVCFPRISGSSANIGVPNA